MNTVDVLKSSFSPHANGVLDDQYTKWNNNNFEGVILNIDGSCHGSPIRTGFGGILRNI